MIILTPYVECFASNGKALCRPALIAGLFPVVGISDSVAGKSLKTSKTKELKQPDCINPAQEKYYEPFSS